jgi:hypothetical protein
VAPLENESQAGEDGEGKIMKSLRWYCNQFWRIVLSPLALVLLVILLPFVLFCEFVDWLET